MSKSKKIILGALALGVAYALTSPTAPPEPSPEPPTPEPAPAPTRQDYSNTTVLTADTGSSKGISGMDTDKWKAADWARALDALMENGYTAQDALERLWLQFASESNPNLPYLPNQDAFSMAIILYKANEGGNIGSWNGTAVTWASTPVHATWTRWWYGQPYWGLDQWMQFHRSLESRFGNTRDANAVFMQHWSHADNKLCDATWGVGCWRCDATEYFNSKNLNIMTYGATTACNVRNAGSAVITSAANATASTVRVVENAAGAGADASESFRELSKYAPYIGIAAGLLYLKMTKII